MGYLGICCGRVTRLDRNLTNIKILVNTLHKNTSSLKISKKYLFIAVRLGITCYLIFRGVFKISSARIDIGEINSVK